MKVKIISCSNNAWWYKDYIGKIVDVEYSDVKSKSGFYRTTKEYFNEYKKNHIVVIRVTKTVAISVWHSDCIVLDREKKLERILK